MIIIRCTVFIEYYIWAKYPAIEALGRALI